MAHVQIAFTCNPFFMYALKHSCNQSLADYRLNFQTEPGIDRLQHVCNRLIISSLPWTHAEFEQLKGRIYKQGQIKDQVDVVVPLTYAADWEIKGIDISFIELRSETAIVDLGYDIWDLDESAQKHFSEKINMGKKGLHMIGFGVLRLPLLKFGLQVRMRRFKLEMTQEKLAEKADLHPTYVGSVERRERNIALENIIVLAKALGCSPRDLLPK